MAHFAQLDEDSIVVQVIVVSNNDILDKNGNESEELGIQFCKDLLGHDKNWVQTSYNSSFRKRYGRPGYFYDEIRDAFIPPKPYPSWILNEDTCLWESPIPYPDTSNIPAYYQIYNIYYWREDFLNWDLRKPYISWILNQDNYYEPPMPYPNNDNNYLWNENNQSWDINE